MGVSKPVFSVRSNQNPTLHQCALVCDLHDARAGRKCLQPFVYEGKSPWTKSRLSRQSADRLPYSFFSFGTVVFANCLVVLASSPLKAVSLPTCLLVAEEGRMPSERHS